MFFTFPEIYIHGGVFVVPFLLSFSYCPMIVQCVIWLQGIGLILFLAPNSHGQKSKGLSQDWSRSWDWDIQLLRMQSWSLYWSKPLLQGSLLHYVGSWEKKWKSWTQIAVRQVSPMTNHLIFVPSSIVTTLRLSTPKDSGKRSCMIWSPSPQGEEHYERLCRREEETDNRSHWERENSSPEEWRDQIKQRKKTLMCHLQVLCGQVMEQWDTKQERDERKRYFPHLFPSF